MNGNKKKWTILYYANGNNEYEPEMFNTFLEAQKINIDGDINLVFELGRLGQEEVKIIRNNIKPNINGDAWEGVRRYYIENNRGLLVTSLGKINMASAKNLYDFLSFGVNNFPAEHYMVVIGGHGAGFVGTLTDYSQDTPYIMGTVQMCDAINKLTDKLQITIDVLVLDICNMNSIEIIYEFLNRQQFGVRYVLTYKGSGPIDGINIRALASSIINNSINIDDLVKELISSCNKNLIGINIDYNLLEYIKNKADLIAREYLRLNSKNITTFEDSYEGKGNNSPWYDNLNRLKEEMDKLVIYKNNCLMKNLINITTKNPGKLIKIYGKYKFAFNNNWTKLLGDVVTNRESLGGNAYLQRPYVIKADGMKTLIKIMNPDYSKPLLEATYIKFIDKRKWNLT